MSDHCYACTCPLMDPEHQGASDIYCKFCTDERGNLKPCDQVRSGIAHWMRTWQSGLAEEVAIQRAALFMKALPAWAGD